MPWERPLYIVQLTDTHLRQPPGDIKDSGRDTDRCLVQVLDAIAVGEQPLDLVLATGDLAEDRVVEVYERLADYFGRLPCPVLCLPGNHDDPALMATHLSAGNCLYLDAWHGGVWQIVALDSTVAGETGGTLSAAALNRLEQQLQQYPERHALICLHHQPVPTGNTHMDRLMLANPEALFTLIDRHPQVRGLLFGHIHDAYHDFRGQRHLMGTPSTCIQLEMVAGQLVVSPRPPGYRRLRLLPDGHIETEVVYLNMGC